MTNASFRLSAWVVAVCAIAGFGCTADPKTQVLTGRVSTHGAIAVRAIAGETIITAGRVRSDGSFTLSLPAGHRYRLEVLTSAGVHNVVMTNGGELQDIAFKVCDPQPPFDMGGFGEPGCDPMDPNNMGCGDPPPCDPNDPDCKPYPCDPMTDPTCVICADGTMGPNCPPPCDPMDPNCMMPPPCDPTDPNCVPPPPPCDPMTDPNCVICADGTMGPNCPPPCDPTTDPMCKCYPGDPNCPPPCDPMTDPTCGQPCDPMTDPTCGQPCDPNDPNCVVCADGTMDPSCKCDWWTDECEPVPPCDPMVDPMCPTPPPPCTDPMDPNTCKDPCMVDPLSCGCGTEGGQMDPTDPNGTTMDDNTCWPPPEPCTMDSCPDDPWQPDHPPGDFGCGDGGDVMTLPAEDGTK